MTTIKVNELDDMATLNDREAAEVMGGYELKNVIVSSFAGKPRSGYVGGVQVATGDVNGDG